MFGLNWGELVVIGIVALIAIGPKELPTVLRTVGQWMGKVRRMANEFQGQFQEALREAELTDLQKHADDIGSSVSSLANIDPLAEEQKELERIGEGAGNLPSEAVVTEPAAASPAAEATPALPDISVPMPELPPPPSEKDFAAAEPDKTATAEPAPKAGGGA
jgi:sec-independent protein translocase protein TatB